MLATDSTFSEAKHSCLPYARRKILRGCFCGLLSAFLNRGKQICVRNALFRCFNVGCHTTMHTPYYVTPRSNSR